MIDLNNLIELNGDEESNNVLLTELQNNAYSSTDDENEEDDDDDILFTPKKALKPVIYENDIYNEKDWDTDLEG
jgi:hypothetical protein